MANIHFPLDLPAQPKLKRTLHQTVFPVLEDTFSGVSLSPVPLTRSSYYGGSFYEYAFPLDGKMPPPLVRTLPNGTVQFITSDSVRIVDPDTPPPLLRSFYPEEGEVDPLNLHMARHGFFPLREDKVVKRSRSAPLLRRSSTLKY